MTTTTRAVRWMRDPASHTARPGAWALGPITPGRGRSTPEPWMAPGPGPAPSWPATRRAIWTPATHWRSSASCGTYGPRKPARAHDPPSAIDRPKPGAGNGGRAEDVRGPASSPQPEEKPMNTTTRSEISRALAKAIAYRDCGEDAKCEAWAAELVRLLHCERILLAPRLFARPE